MIVGFGIAAKDEGGIRTVRACTSSKTAVNRGYRQHNGSNKRHSIELDQIDFSVSFREDYEFTNLSAFVSLDYSSVASTLTVKPYFQSFGLPTSIVHKDRYYEEQGEKYSDYTASFQNCKATSTVKRKWHSHTRPPLSCHRFGFL